MKVISPDLQNTNGVQSKKPSRVADAKKDRSVGGSEAKGRGNSDKIAISGAGAQMKSFSISLKEIPDVRTEKVQSIKSEIESGRYNPPAELIADAMMQSIQRYS